MQPSDFSLAYMPIVRLSPPWAGPACVPDTNENLPSSDERTSPRANGVYDCARLLVRQAICAGRMLLSGQRYGVSTSKFDPFRSSIPSPWSPL